MNTLEADLAEIRTRLDHLEEGHGLLAEIIDKLAHPTLGAYSATVAVVTTETPAAAPDNPPPPSAEGTPPA